MAATLACVVLFVIAGIWQINRGQAKEVILTQRQAASKGPVQPLMALLGTGSDAEFEKAYGRGVSVRGHYDGAHQILLDNQTYKKRVGYRVWTPLVLENGRRILVDRGWVPMGSGGRDDRPQPAAPDGMIKVEGLFRTLPKPGIRLTDVTRCDMTAWPRVLNYPTIKTVRCQYQAPVVNGIILLSDKAPHGFVRQWQADAGMSPQRHYAYAVQWFAMALAVVIVFFVVNMKRIR